MPADISWLTRHAITHETRYPFMQAPFAVDGWACATDSRALVAIAGAGAGLYVPHEDFASMVRGLLSIAGAEFQVPFGSLREWCGKPATSECLACEDTGKTGCVPCLGTGKEQQECEACGDLHACLCNDCGGGGKRDCATCSPRHAQRPEDDPERDGWVGPVLLDRRLLGHALTLHLPSRGIVGVVAEGGDKNQIRLRGAGWVVVLMGRNAWNGSADAARFALEAV